MSEVTEIKRNASVEFRPRRFSEVIGYGPTLARLKNQFASGVVPMAMMFVGISRGGKTTLAKIIAASLNCEHGEFGEPCDECIQKVEDRTYEVWERNAALVGKVDDIRSLVGELNTVPNGNYRVIILDECQQMTKDAQNVLLKPTEDKDNTFNVFIFCTTDPEKIIAPLRKRCESASFTLEGLNEAEVKRLVWTTSQKIAVDGGWNTEKLKQLFTLLWEREIVAPGDIVNAVEKLSNGASPEQAAVTADFSGKVNVYRLINAMHNRDWSVCREELSLAEARDGAEIMVRLGANLRSKLLGPNSMANYQRISRFIEILLACETPIVGMQLTGVASAIYQMCHYKFDAVVQPIREAA